MSGYQLLQQATVIFKNRDRNLFSTSFFIAFCVTSKGSSRGKFTEFVSYHLLADEDRNVLLAIVNGDSMTYHFGHNG
jgi:hypothetical protein